MTNVSDWSVTAGLNNSSPPDGWPKGMARSAVNDTARQMMALLARWFQDSNGSLTATTVNGLAYTLATNSVYTSLADLPLLSFKMGDSLTGAMTLNVDGLGAKPVYRDNVQSPLQADELGGDGMVVVQYWASADAFQVVSPSLGDVQSGSRMIFNQTAAPAGWDKEVGAGFNDCALRLVTGTAASGGATAFTSVLTTRTIATANLPAHTHDAGSFSVGTSITNGTQVNRQGNSNNVYASTGSFSAIQTIASATISLANGSVSGTSDPTGSGTAMDFAVKYVDMIIAQKNNTD